MPNQIPTPRSKPQILGDMLDAFTSRFGIPRLKIGTPVLSILEAAAQSDMRSSQDIFDLLRSGTLDDTTGLALDRRGADESTPRIFEGPAIGTVTVTDTSFTKITSKLYQGAPAPLVGSGSINVTDASSFPVTGSVYIGRGTSNYEGPLAYTAKINNGTYWTLTLSASTARYHNVGESVIVAQGGLRTVSAGALVQTPQGAVSSAVQFSVLYPAAIPDGETQVTNVTVIATKNGVIGNVAAGAITSFVTNPFSGASVTNPLPFTNATSTEDDDTYRERIRSARASRTKGTDIAILSAVQGVVAADENRRVASASLVKRQGYPTVLYIDDGTGYEESSQGVAFESINDSAFGGETWFQVASARPVTKAFLQSSISAPFSLTAGMNLAFAVGGVQTTHTFNATDARAISAMTAYEAVASINADSTLLWGARTAASGTQVVVFAKSDTNEDIQNVAVANDANPYFGFPSTVAYTARLYKNDRPLTKDGKLAAAASQPFANWGAISGTQTLSVSVDGTTAVPYSISAQDFVNANTGYTSVGLNSPAAWAAVLNNKIPGQTTTVTTTGLVMTSNLGASSRAQIAITGGSLTPAMFQVQTVTGASSDFTFDRNLSQGRLAVSLAAGDRLTLGSSWSRAFAESPAFTTLTLPGQGNLWFSIDGSSSVIPTALTSSSSIGVTVSGVSRWGYRMRFTSIAGDYSNVQIGDQAVFWDPACNADLQLGTWYVAEIDSAGGWFEIEKRSMPFARAKFTATRTVSGGATQILVCGGYTGWGSTNPTASAHLYNPTTKAWTALPNMTVPRAGHTAVALNDANNRVFVFGGVTGNSQNTATNTGEIFDPTANGGAGSWTAVTTTSAPSARSQHAAVLRADSKVMIIGGQDANGNALGDVYVYDPAGSWSTTGSLAIPRWNHAVVLFTSDSSILVVGGENASNALNSSERWTGAAWSTDISTPQGSGRSGGRLVALPGFTNKALFVGGSTAKEINSNSGNATSYADIYTVGGAPVWTTTGSLNAACSFHTLTTTNDGNVVAGFGIRGSSNKVEYYSGGSWSTRALPVGKIDRVHAQALTTALNNNVVMFLGGQDLDAASTCIASAEIFDEGANSWSTTDLNVGTVNITATGLSFIRAQAPLQYVSIASGTSYTASSLASLIALNGAFAQSYRTNKLRISTNSYALGTSTSIGGDIALSVADANGKLLGIATGGATSNIQSHMASVESANEESGTPIFRSTQIRGAFGLNNISVDTIVPAATGTISTTAGSISLSGTGTSFTQLGVGYQVSGDGGTTWVTIASISTDTTAVLTNAAPSSWSNVAWVYRNPAASFNPPANSILSVGRSPADSYTTLARRFGANYGFRSTLVSSTLDRATATSSTVQLSKSVQKNWMAGDRAFFTHPYSLGPEDTFVFVADGDTTSKRFAPNMYRRLATVGATYGTTNTFTDLDAGGSLAASFGFGSSGFDFTDFAVYMRARCKTHDSPPYSNLNKTILWRYWRFGSAGNMARVRYVLPSSASQSVGVTVDDTSDGYINCSISLASGALKTGYSIRSNTMVGTFTNGISTNNMASVGYVLGFPIIHATRTGNITTLTLDLTFGGQLAAGVIANCGFSNGQSLYVKSNNVNFASGNYSINGCGSFDGNSTGRIDQIQYTDANPNVADQGAIGDISFDTTEATLAGTSGGVNVGDFFQLGSTAGVVAGSFVGYKGNTLRISATASQLIYGVIPEGVSGPNVNTTVTWAQLSDVTAFQIFSNPAQTATTIAAAVTALYNATNSICPIYPTVIGNGTGTIDRATAEETTDSGTYNGPSFYYQMSDGVNWVQSTTIPGTVGGNYQLTFKNPIDNSALASNSDWTHEEVRVAPSTAANVVAWLNAPTVCGAFSACSISASSRARRIQIASNTMGSKGSVQVQGGSANALAVSLVGSATPVPGTNPSFCVASINRSDLVGFTGGMHVALQNAISLPKGTGVAGTVGITPNTNFVSVDTAGNFTFSSAAAGDKLWDFSATPSPNVIVQVEKQGRFIAIHDTGLGLTLSLSGASEGDWLYIQQPALPTGGNTPAIKNANTGTFRIVRIVQATDGGAGTIWIENTSGVEDQAAECDIKILKYDSIMPGDSLVILSSIWGQGNIGTWTVKTVGASGGINFTNGNQYSFAVDVSTKATSTFNTGGLLGNANFRQVQILEAAPSRLIKRILTTCPNPTNGSIVDVKFGTAAGYTRIAQAAGTTMVALDRFAFPTALVSGMDGYAHSVGLVGEVNRVVYGDPRDPATYPGVASSGAVINIAGPNVRRIQIAIQIRVKSGAAANDIAAAVKSAVAAVINKSGVGQPIALGAVVVAAQKVPGVISAVITSPTYNSSNDLISIQPFEKPLILNLDSDITVSFIGV